jgi:hypothetical protein
MNVYQPLATSTVELSLAATPVCLQRLFSLQRLGLISDKNTRKKASSLAVHAVKRAAVLITNGADVPRSPEFLQGLERFETCGSYLLHFLHDPDLLPSALDMIRRHVESIPEQGTKPRKISFSALTFFRESARLKTELDRNHKTVVCGLNFASTNIHLDLLQLEMSKKPTMPSSTSRNECILEVVTLGARAAGAICDIPGVNFLKPVFGMLAVICDTAKAYIIPPIHCDPNNIINRLFMVTTKRHWRWQTMLKTSRI